MSGATAYLPSEADQLEKLTDDLTTKEWNDVWEVYESRGFDSAALVAQKYKTAFKTRYKVVGDAIDQALEHLRAAATTAAQTSGDTAIADQIIAFADRLAPARPVAAAKSYSPARDPLAIAVGADQVQRGRARVATKSTPQTMKDLISSGLNNWDGR